MKKTWVALLCLALLLAGIPALADAAVVGTWQSAAGELVVSEDGTAQMSFVSGVVFDMTWGEEDGKAVFTSGNWQGAVMELRDDGQLSIGYNWMVLSRVGGMPEVEAGVPAVGAGANAVGGAAAAGGAAFSVGAEGDLEARLNRKFVATTYTTAGMTMDASVMGEFSVIFYEDGTCDFTILDMQTPGLSWGLGQVSVGLNQVDAFVINFSGVTFNAVLTDEGFDLDYYGSMMLHFVPVE